MDEFFEIFQDIGMPVTKNKTLGPTTVLEYLGLTLNFELQLICVPEKKRTKCLLLLEKFLEAYHAKRKVTVKTVQKSGSLNFITQALPAGCPFLYSLYRMTRNSCGQKLRIRNHKRISHETYLDMLMFKLFLEASAHLSVQSIPFLHHLEIDNDNIELFADAAGTVENGIRCCFRSEWFFGKWSDTNLFHNGFRPNIALLELVAIVSAFDIWAPHLTGKTITLRSDNEATCAFINRKRSDIPTAMSLIRNLILSCLHFQIFLKAKHIPGKLNSAADLISRQKMTQLFHLYPNMNHYPQPAPRSWPPMWDQDLLINHR